MQRKALRTTVMRMTDELRHERAAREAAEASLKTGLEVQGRMHGENAAFREMLHIKTPTAAATPKAAPTTDAAALPWPASAASTAAPWDAPAPA